jgi:hypothetical protein
VNIGEVQEQEERGVLEAPQPGHAFVDDRAPGDTL